MISLTIINFSIRYVNIYKPKILILVEAIEHINLVKKQLMAIRENVSVEFNKLHNIRLNKT